MKDGLLMCNLMVRKNTCRGGENYDLLIDDAVLNAPDDMDLIKTPEDASDEDTSPLDVFEKANQQQDLSMQLVDDTGDARNDVEAGVRSSGVYARRAALQITTTNVSIAEYLRG